MTCGDNLIQKPNNHAVSFTDDGLIHSELYDDGFFSDDGAAQESTHVFLDGNNLLERWEAIDAFQIGELGFGTGLNFLLAAKSWAKHAPSNAHLTFTSYEKHPLRTDDLLAAHRAFGTPEKEAGRLAAFMDQVASGLNHFKLTESITLDLIIGDALAELTCWSGKADAWFLDGFAPSKNPDLWSPALMKQVYDHTGPGGTFSTYTVAGRVRRALEQAGFAIERAEGFGRKREMLRGRRPDDQ